MKIEDLGLTKEELLDVLAQKIIDKSELDDYDYRESIIEKAEKNMQKMIQEAVKDSVENIGDEVVKPRIDELVEGHCIQRTTSYGEAIGEEMTFKEFLIQCAQDYMAAPVDSSGQTKKESSYTSWRQSSNRLSFLIDKKIGDAIRFGVDAALKDIKSDLGKALSDQIKVSVNKITSGIEVKVK